MTKQIEGSRKESRLLSFNIFNFNMNKIFVGMLALAVIFGGGGMVAASNSALPGDFLFPVELAIENIQIKFSGDDKKEELRLRFAEERVSEIRKVSDKKSTPASPLVADLSGVTTLQIEADVFTSETVVKIEANDKKYGYISVLKTKTELAKEISAKYSVPEDKVLAVINFEIEDRESRADDKGFLNKTLSINFSERESEDVSRSLSAVEAFLGENDNGDKEELRKSLEEILILLGDDGKLEIRRQDGRVKIETKNGEIKIKMKSDSSGQSNDDSDDDDNNDDNDKSSDDSSLNNNDVKEDDSEVFCRGEWRDSEDCDDSDDSDDDDDDDDDDDEDEDSGSSKGDDDSDDNSGSGEGDNN
jgi:hypothetical protein